MKIRIDFLIRTAEEDDALGDFRVSCDGMPVVDFTRTLGKLQIMMGGEYAIVEQPKIKSLVAWIAHAFPELFEVIE